jgi:hypothetical protein
MNSIPRPNWLTDWLPPRSRVLVDKPTVAQPPKKFPAFNETWSSYRVQKIPPLISILSQMNPVDTHSSTLIWHKRRIRLYQWTKIWAFRSSRWWKFISLSSGLWNRGSMVRDYQRFGGESCFNLQGGSYDVNLMWIKVRYYILLLLTSNYFLYSISFLIWLVFQMCRLQSWTPYYHWR